MSLHGRWSSAVVGESCTTWQDARWGYRPPLTLDRRDYASQLHALVRSHRLQSSLSPVSQAVRLLLRRLPGAWV